MDFLPTFEDLRIGATASQINSIFNEFNKVVYLQKLQLDGGKGMFDINIHSLF